MINRLLSLYYVEKKDFQRAVAHAERIIRNFPNHAQGYLRKAVGLKEMREYTKALKFYRRALTRTEEQQRKTLYQAMAQCHFALKQYRRAYAILMRSENLFSPALGHLDLYRLALAAYQAGKTDEARMLAKFAAFKQPDGKKAQDPRISQLIRILEKTPQ
jgi:tetratricopeptide (TPR) repeat protein